LRHEDNKRKNALLVRRRFLQELLASYREWTSLQAAEAKRLKQRNDGVMNWHAKEAKRYASTTLVEAHPRSIRLLPRFCLR
jgi:hypothetical protein